MAAKIEERIDALALRLKQLRAQQQRQEARRRSIETRRTRREDVRRKVLVGAVVLERVQKGLLEEAVLKSWLDSAITRAEDRALFGLDSREIETSAPQPSCAEPAGVVPVERREGARS